LNRNLLFLIMALCLIVFAGLSFLTAVNSRFMLDEQILQWVQTINSPFLLGLMQGATIIGSVEFIFVISAALMFTFLLRRNWYLVIFLSVLSAGGIVLNYVLKILFQRARPGEMTYIELFGFSFELASYSFPSGHTMRTVLLFAFLIYLSFLLTKNYWVRFVSFFAALVIILSVAASRVIVGAHYPSDILAAVAASIVWAGVCWYFISDDFRHKRKGFNPKETEAPQQLEEEQKERQSYL
jgi:undecaprenyl-diphosphatase